MTPKKTKDSHMLLEQIGDLWWSHRFRHVANCKLKASLTLVFSHLFLFYVSLFYVLYSSVLSVI